MYYTYSIHCTYMYMYMYPSFVDPPCLSLPISPFPCLPLLPSPPSPHSGFICTVYMYMYMSIVLCFSQHLPGYYPSGPSHFLLQCLKNSIMYMYKGCTDPIFLSHGGCTDSIFLNHTRCVHSIFLVVEAVQTIFF